MAKQTFIPLTGKFARCREVRLGNFSLDADVALLLLMAHHTHIFINRDRQIIFRRMRN